MRPNKAQERASKFSHGPTLVLAGAGTGKTSTMVKRIENTLPIASREGKSVVVLTFTQKAAREIKERIENKISVETDNLFSGTIHSFAYNIICFHSEEFNSLFNRTGAATLLPDEDEERELLRLFKTHKSNFLGIPFRTVHSIYTKGKKLPKNKAGIATELEAAFQSFFDSIELFKKENNLLGFNDLIPMASQLLKNVHNIRKEIQKRTHSVFVDEFQDTSPEDIELIKLILTEEQNIFMVGDDYQAIYGFRGADMTIIMNLKKRFPNLAIHKLTENYRSRKEILKVAEKIIRHNKFKTRKRLIARRGKGGKVSIVQTQNQQEEIEKIKDLIESAPEKDTAILVRNNSQVSHLEKNLSTEPSKRPQILTMHKSKGLEFQRVIIAGIGDNVFPSPLSEIEEERRLFFVAITRAKEELILMYSAKSRTKPQFIEEILQYK